MGAPLYYACECTQASWKAVCMWNVCVGTWHMSTFSRNWRSSEVPVALIRGPVKEMTVLPLAFRAICQLPLSLFLPTLDRSLCLAPLSPGGAKPTKG